jgi:L-threonylcarbamoyladenylate synthase
MTGPPVVTARQLEGVRGALDSGRPVAVPGDGGYQVAIRHDHGDALVRWRQGVSPIDDATIQIAVGRRDQVAQLTPRWDKEMSRLTDRMWPGPLTIILPSVAGDAVVHVTMPAWRPLRSLCRRSGPLAVIALHGADGEPLVTADEVCRQLTDEDVAFVVDGGPRRGPGSTLVDCTTSPPEVRRPGALPESYVEAALLMGVRRRSWLARRPPQLGRP